METAAAASAAAAETLFETRVRRLAAESVNSVTSALEVAGAAGVVVLAGAGVAKAGAALAFLSNSSSNRRLEALALFEFNSDRQSDRHTKKPAEYLVMLLMALPDPAPNKASVAPPPKATPAPASFFGIWINTRRIRNRQFKTRINVKNPINKLIIQIR